MFRHVFFEVMRCLLFFPRCCSVDSPPMSPSLLYLKPLRNSKTFLHVIYKSKKKTNLLCILNNVFQFSKIRTRKRNAKKSIKTEKNLDSTLWIPDSSSVDSGFQKGLDSKFFSVLMLFFAFRFRVRILLN